MTDKTGERLFHCAEVVLNDSMANSLYFCWAICACECVSSILLPVAYLSACHMTSWHDHFISGFSFQYRNIITCWGQREGVKRGCCGGGIMESGRFREWERWGEGEDRMIVICRGGIGEG